MIHESAGSQNTNATQTTSSGADTAALISPAPSNKFFDIKIRELIAKPGDF